MYRLIDQYIVTSVSNEFCLLLRAPGKIVESYVGDFEALSNNGELMVLVKNTGRVQSDYTVRTLALYSIP